MPRSSSAREGAPLTMAAVSGQPTRLCFDRDDSADEVLPECAQLSERGEGDRSAGHDVCCSNKLFPEGLFNLRPGRLISRELTVRIERDDLMREIGRPSPEDQIAMS